MPSTRIPMEALSGTYYLTFTVRNWYHFFDRYDRFVLLADSVKYCQIHKGLKVYGYVFMLNHIHLIATAPDMIAFIRDFKKFTSKEMHKSIIANEPDVMALFEKDEVGFEFWAKTNMPKAIESEGYLLQKISYIQDNPVRKQYVDRPEDWAWSSANPESEIKIEPAL